MVDGMNIPRCSSTSCGDDQLPIPKIMLAPSRSAISPSKAPGPRSLMARVSVIGGPFDINSGYSNVTFSQLVFSVDEIESINNGCAVTKSSFQNPPPCIPWRPRMTVQSLISIRSVNSSQADISVEVLLVHPSAPIIGALRNSILASKGSDSSDS